jgi:glutamine synthetase
MLSAVKDGGTVRRDIVKTARDRGVKWIRLAFVDIAGIEKNITIPVSVDGGSIDGFIREEELDMLLRPDPATFAVLPWTLESGSPEARMLCDIAMPDGTPFEGCPRSTLKRVLDDAEDVIRGVKTSLEVEFYLFQMEADGTPTTRTIDAGSYFDFSPADRGDDARTAMAAALESMGIGVLSTHHEHGAGQHELDLADGSVLGTADRLITVRGAVKQIANRHGIHATFMPKPIASSAGSGLHVYFALGDIDEVVRLHAIAGLLDHAPGFTAVCNPTVNSYKRLMPAWDAPVYTVWSQRSANALVRVPPPIDGAPLLEIRSPDAACNPYLALAVMIEAIADGIRSRTLPGDPFTGSTYELREKYRKDHGIRTLPHSLGEAIAALDADLVMRGALGDHIYHAFRDAKLAEFERYRLAVHEWEHQEYLRKF